MRRISVISITQTTAPMMRLLTNFVALTFAVTIPALAQANIPFQDNSLADSEASKRDVSQAYFFQLAI